MPAATDHFDLQEDARRVRLAVGANDDPASIVVGYTDPAHGVIELIGDALRYTPDRDFVGVDSFFYTAVSADGALTTAAVGLTVVDSNIQLQSLVDARIAPEIDPSGRTATLTKVAQLTAGDGDAIARPNEFLTFDDRMFVLDQGDAQHGAVIFELAPADGGALDPVLFFDIDAAMAANGRAIEYGSGLTRGVRGFAFHPDFAENGLFYTSMLQRRSGAPDDVVYLSDPAAPILIDSVLVEWRRDATGGGLDPASYREVFRVGLPANQHPIGQVSFNPLATPGDDDYGLLYVAHGDSSSQQAAEGGGLRNDALGKILRINPIADGDAPFSIPASNPFVGSDDMPDSVYSLGHRNPQRFSFFHDGDGATQILLAEIGRDNFEEINLIVAGQSYGWSEREGPLRHLNELEGAVTGVAPLPADDAATPRSYPVAFVGHDDVIGGRSLRIAIAGGAPINNGSVLDGQYVFGDFAGGGRFYSVSTDALLGAMTTLDPTDPARDGPEDLTWATPSQLTLLHDHDGDPATAAVVVSSFKDVTGGERTDLRFGTGPDGALYATSKQNGAIYRLAETTPVADDPGAVIIVASGAGLDAPASFSVFADGVYLGEGAVQATYATGQTLAERFTFILPGGVAPTRVEIAFHGAEPSLTATLAVERVAFGGVVYDGEADGRFAPQAGDAGNGRIAVLDQPGVLAFAAAGAPPPAPMRIEAEDFARIAGFVPHPVLDASGGTVIQYQGGGEAIARHSFTGPAGLYELGVGHFDENDATASMRVLVNGAQVDAWSWNLDLGSRFPDSQTLTTREAGVVALLPGDVIELRGLRAPNEPVRTDFVDLTWVSTLWDDVAPVVRTSSGPGGIAVGAMQTTLRVVYGDDRAIDAQSIDTTDIIVTGPDGQTLTVVAASASIDAETGDVTALYQVEGPQGRWDLQDAGLYRASIADGAVSDAAGNSLSGVTDLLTFSGPQSVRFEAETFSLDTNFSIEAIGNRAVSGRAVIRAGGSGESVATLTFDGPAGRHALTLGYFDESDGASSLSVHVDGDEVDAFVWDGNTSGSALADAGSKAERMLGVFNLEAGDVIQFRGVRDLAEPLRLDYLDMTLTADTLL